MYKSNNTQLDDAQNVDLVMPIYQLIKYCDYYKDVPIIHEQIQNHQFKLKFTGNTNTEGRKKKQK